MNRYDCMFGSVDKTIAFIIDSCGYDCYCCPFPCSIPCFREFGCDLNDEDLKKALEEWLLEDCDCKGCRAGE